MTASIQKTVTVTNPLGIHLRPAHILSKAAAKFESLVEIEKDGQAIDCKSIISILTLGAQQGTQLELRACGTDAQQAVESISQLFEGGFSENDSELSSGRAG